MSNPESDREKIERLRVVAKRVISAFSEVQPRSDIAIGCCAAWIDVLYWLDNNFPVQPEPVLTVAGSIAIAAMQQSLGSGKEINIPSLGIVIKPSGREDANDCTKY